MNTYKVEEAVKIGRDHHWRFREMGRKGTLDEPLPREGWWYFPANTDTVIPQNAKKRIDVLEKSGFKIQQIVIGHEASKLLAAPAKPVPIKIPKVKKPKKAPIGIAKVLTASMKLVVGVVAAAASVMVFVMGTALGTVLLLDPTVIVVLEDGTWLECMSWYE